MGKPLTHKQDMFQRVERAALKAERKGKHKAAVKLWRKAAGLADGQKQFMACRAHAVDCWNALQRKGLRP